MKTKTILILLCLVTQVFQTNGLIQLKNSLAHSDSPLLKKILELVDAAVNDEHLLQVTLKLLRSLCTCMRETLKTKEVNLNIGNYPLDLNESSGTQGKVFELYKNIYNNTCFNLRQDLTNRTYKFIVDEEAEFLNHTNCGNDEKNETIDERDDSDKSSAVKHLTISRLEQVLFKALIQTKDLHEYRLRKYNLFGKGTPQLKKALQHILIVILTLHPDKQEISSRRHNIEEKDLNNTLYTKSPIDIDIISTEHDQTLKDQAIKAEICSECNLQSLYISLTESDRNNQIKVFKLIRKRDTIKIYTEVKIKQNHTDLINICCKSGTKIPQCNRGIINDFMTQPMLIDKNYKNTITKIRSLVNQYEHKLNDTIQHNLTTTVQDEKKEEILIKESTTKQSGTNADRINDKENDIQVSVTNSKESSKLDEVTQAIVLLSDFVSKQTTKTYLQTHQTDRTDSFKPWTEFMLKEEMQQEITTPYNSINIGTTLNVKGHGYLLGKHITKVSNSSSTTILSTEQSTETALHYFPSLNLVSLANNTMLSTAAAEAASTPIFNNSLYGGEQTLNDAQNIFETSILENSTDVTKIIAESEPMNETFATEESKASVSNAIPNVTSTNELTENVIEIGQLFTLGASMLDDEVKPKETKTFPTDSLAIKNLSETSIKSKFQNIAPNTTFKPVTTPESYKQLVPGHMDDMITVDIVTKPEPTSKIAFYITVEKPNEKKGTKRVTLESLEKNKISKTTFQNVAINTKPFVESLTILDDMEKSYLDEETTTKPTFMDTATNTTLESLTTLYTLDFIKSHNQSGSTDMEGINITDTVSKAESTSPFASHIMVDAPHEQTETKNITSEYLETNNITETTIQNVAMNTKPVSLTVDSVQKSHNQSFLDDMGGTNIIDRVRINKAKPMSTINSYEQIDELNEQTETNTFTLESLETNIISETTMKTKFKDIATNTTLESLRALPTIDSTKSHKQSIYDDIEGIETTDIVTKAEPMSTFPSHIMVEMPNEETKTKTSPSESLETSNISETTVKRTLQNIATNMTLEPFTSLPTLESTKSDNQAVYDDIDRIDTTTKAELMSTFNSHIMVVEPVNPTGQQLRTNVTKNGIIKISTIETTFSKSTKDLNNTYNGMNFDMSDDLFEEGEPNNYTNAGTKPTNEYKTNEQSYMTTGVPVNTEEINTIDIDNEKTLKSTDALSSEMELQMRTEFFKVEYNKVNSTFPATIYTNPGTDTNTQSYKTTSLSVDTEETIVNTQDIVSTLVQNVTDKEITMKSTNIVTPDQELRIITEFNKEEPNKLNATFPGIILTQSAPSTELTLQSEVISTYSANPLKSRDTVDKQNNKSTELFYTPISTEPYSKTVHEDYTTLIPTLIIKHSVTTSNPEFHTSDDIQNTESVNIQTFFDNDYEVANNLAKPEILSAKTNTLSEAIVMERNENNLKSEPMKIKESNHLENTSIFTEATTGFDESLASEILDIMNLTTKIPFTKHTLPLELENDILQKELETEDNVTLNDTFVITTYSGIEGISDAPSGNVSKALPNEVKKKLFHKNIIMVSNTSLKEMKNLSSEHSLSAKLNKEDPFQKESEIEVTVALESTFETSTNSEMERINDKLSEDKIKVTKNDSESLAQEESVVNRLFDKEVSLLFYTLPEDTFTSKRNFSEKSLDKNTESVQKVDNNGLKTLSNQNNSSITESSSPYLSSTEITKTDLPEFTREYTTIIANISANDLFAENNATFVHKELYTMPESGTNRPSTNTFTLAVNSTIFFTQELNDTVDMELTKLGIIAQQDQTDESHTMPTFIIAVGSALNSIAQYTLKHEDMKVSVPGIRTKNHENILDDNIITDELISSPTHTEATKNDDFDYFGNDGTTLTLENESCTKNTAVNIAHEKRIPDLNTLAIITTTERSTLETLILKNLSSSQVQNNTEDLITTESESEIIDMKNDTNVENIIESSLFTPESVISDVILSTPATLSSTEAMQDTTINKQQTTSVMKIKESTLFNIESVISALRLSTPSTLSSTQIVQNTTKSKQLTKSDMDIKQILESQYIGTTQHTFIEAWQTTQLDAGSNATITGPIFEANEETKTEKLAQLNDILTHITTQQTNFMTQPVYKDYTLFEEETESSIEPTTKGIQFYSDKSKIMPVYDLTESIINARIKNASTESFSFESHIQESSIINNPFTSHVMESTQISPKSKSKFTQAKNYTKEANVKHSKSLKRKIKTKKPIAFELNIRVGVETNKDGIKFSVLDEKETVIHEKPELNFANETVNNNATSLGNKIKDIDLNNTSRRSHNIGNEDLCRITEILKKLSWKPPTKTQRPKNNPKRMKTRKSFAGNTTMNEEIQLTQVNTTSYNATTTSTHKKFTSIKHKSIMPGALTEQYAITNITSIYKKHFEILEDFMNNTKKGNKSATDVLKKKHEAMLALPVTGNVENTRLYTTRVNNTLQEDQEDMEVGSKTSESAKNNSVKSEPTLNKNETSKTSKLINKKIEIMLKKLLEGKKLSKRQLRKFKRKLLKKLTSKKSITNVHKFYDTVEKKNDVNITTNTVTFTTTNKYTTIQGDNGTEIQNVEVLTSSSSFSEKPNTKIVLLVNNKTQSEEKIRKEIDNQVAVVVILNTTSKGILQGGRRLFDTHSNKSLLSHEIEPESSKFETTYQNTSTETNISFSKVAAITSNEEAHLSEIIFKEIDEDILKPENELLKDTSETLNEVTLNLSDALTKTETLSLFDTHYSDLMKELNVVLTQQNNNKTLSNSGVNSTSTIVTDANNTTVITNTKSNSATRYEISEKILTAPFQTTVGFYGTTPFLNTEFEIVGQNKFSSDKEDSKYTVPMTTVKSNTFDNSEIRSDDNAATVTVPLTSSILTIINVTPQISGPNDNITKTKRHYFKDDILDEIPDQSSKPSEFFFKEHYRRAENLKIVTSKQQTNDVSNTLLPASRIKILTDRNHNKYEEFVTTASKPSASVSINNNQDIILTSPSEFDILTTYKPQPSIMSMYQQSITDLPGTLNKSKIQAPVTGKSLDMEKGRNINDGYLPVDELKSFNAKSTTNSSMIDYSGTSLKYKELKLSDQMFSETLDKEMYKEKQYRNKNNKEITNKANHDFEIIKSCTNINPSNISMIMGQEIILCLRKKISDEIKTSSTVIQDFNIITQHPIEEYFISFADDERESQHSFTSTLGMGEYVETTSNIPDESTTKLSLTQITSKILKIEKETQMRKATNYNNTTSTINTYKQHLSTNTSDGTDKNIENLNNNQKMTKKINRLQKILTINKENLPGLTISKGSATNTATVSTGLTLKSQMGNTSSVILESLSDTHTKQRVLNQSIANKEIVTSVNNKTFVDNVTETIKISSDSSPITTQYIITVIDDVNPFTNVSSNASTHGDKTSSIQVREHEKNLEKRLETENKTQLFYVVDKYVNVTSNERKNITNSRITDSLVSAARTRTKKIPVITSKNNTKHNFFVKVHDGEKKISVISTPTLNHLKVTQMNPVKKTTFDFKPEIQKLLPVSSNKEKLRTDQTNQKGTNGKGNQSNYKSVYPNVGSMEYTENIRSRNINGKISKMEIFSSRLNRPHKVLLTTTTACTKNIKYNTYRPITKEELEILKYFSDPILSTVLHKQVDDKPHSQVPAFNQFNAAMESSSNIPQSESKTTIRAVNNSEDQQMIHAKNQDRGDKDLHLTLAAHKNLNQSIEIVKITHSSEINRISHPILEININSPQIRTNGNSPPMIEINGNPLPIEINRNSAPMEINGNAAPMDINGNSEPMGNNRNSAPMGISRNSAPTGIIGSSAPMGINRNSALMGINGYSAPMSINGNSAPMGIGGNSAPVGIGGNSAPVGIGGNSAPMGINRSSALMGINGYSAPISINGNSAPMGIHGNSAPMGNIGNSAPMGNNGNSAPMGNNGNFAPMVINGNSSPKGMKENNAPVGINGNAAPMGMNGNYVPMGVYRNSAPTEISGNSAPVGMNRNSAPEGTHGNSALMEINGNSAPTGMSGNSAPMGMNENAVPMGMNRNYVPMGVYRNSVPMAMNVNSGPMEMNGYAAPMEMNGNYAPMGINGNSAPMAMNVNSRVMAMYGNSARMGINENSVPMRINGKYVPIGMNGNSLIFDITRNPEPMGINGNSLMMDITRNPAPMGANGNSVPVRINGNSMTMNINRNLVPMDSTNNPVAIEIKGNPMPVGNNGNSEAIGTQRSPLPIGINGNQVPMGTNENLLSMVNNGNSVPIRINENSVPIEMNRNSVMIDSTKNPVPMGIHDSAPMRTSGNSTTMNINGNPVPIELNTNSIPLAINGSPKTMVPDTKLEPLGNNKKTMPMNIAINSVQMGIHGNSVPTKIENNGTSVLMEVNKTSVPSEINRNPAPMEATRNQVLMDINRNSLLMEFNRSLIPQKNNRDFIPQETNNNSNSKESNRDLPRTLETNRNTSPTPNLNRNTLSVMNSSSYTGNNLKLSPTNDKNRSILSMDENNKNVFVENENLSSTTNKPWTSASMFNNNGNSHATIDNNSNLPQIFYKDQNSLLTLNRNKNSPSIIDINRYSLVVNKNSSPTIIHNKWNLSSIMGNNKKKTPVAHNINRHSNNENKKTAPSSGNNMNAHSVIDDYEKSSKNIDSKKSKPSRTRDQSNNKNSLPVVANVSFSPPTVNLHSPSTTETNNKSPSVNNFNHIAHSTFKTDIISEAPTTETKTSEAIVATKKKILPMKEIKRKPFLTFKSNKKPPSITGKKINTHGPLHINRNTHTKFVSKNFKRIGSQKTTLLHSFENINTYAKKIKEPSVQRQIKEMKMVARRKAVKTINTQDFLSQHHYVTPRSVLQKTTKPYSMFLKPQGLILRTKTLRPIFDSIDRPAKRLARKMKPKLLFKKGRSGRNFQRIVPTRSRVNNVLDMPIWHTTLKPKFLKDRNDAMDFMFDDNYIKTMKMTRRPAVTDDLRFFGNNYNPSPSFRRDNMEQPTTQSGRKRQQGRTIFFLSPTEFYDQYKDFE